MQDAGIEDQHVSGVEREDQQRECRESPKGAGKEVHAAGLADAIGAEGAALRLAKDEAHRRHAEELNAVAHDGQSRREADVKHRLGQIGMCLCLHLNCDRFLQLSICRDGNHSRNCGEDGDDNDEDRDAPTGPQTEAAHEDAAQRRRLRRRQSFWLLGLERWRGKGLLGGRVHELVLSKEIACEWRESYTRRAAR